MWTYINPDFFFNMVFNGECIKCQMSDSHIVSGFSSLQNGYHGNEGYSLAVFPRSLIHYSLHNRHSVVYSIVSGKLRVFGHLSIIVVLHQHWHPSCRVSEVWFSTKMAESKYSALYSREWFWTQPLCLVLQHIAECYVCYLTATGLPAYFTCHSALKPAGGKMAEYASSPSSVCFRQEGRLMDENDILSLGRHDVEQLNIHLPVSPYPQHPSISLFI